MSRKKRSKGSSTKDQSDMGSRRGMDYSNDVGGGLVSFIRDIGFDAFHTLRYLSHNLQIGFRRQDHLAKKSKHVPVILVQGFLGTSAVLDPLDQYLRDHERHVFLLDLGIVNIKDIRVSAERLLFETERILEEYSDKYDFKQVDIVAHSMGGLIALYYIRRLGGHRLVRNLITLGTPFRGTWSAYVGTMFLGVISRGVWQMLPRSQFLKELHSRKSPKNETRVYSIAAQYDTISPPSSCFLKGAVNRILPLGHAGLLMDKRVFQTVVNFLDAPDQNSNVVAFDHFRK